MKTDPADLFRFCHDEGFVLAGVASADEKMEAELSAYRRYLEQGKNGSMAFLARGEKTRANPASSFPEMQSVLCVALPYSADGVNPDPSTGPSFARYSVGRDYHLEVCERLERALRRFSEAVPSLSWKICCDTSAVLEKAWAVRAGLGWIGKNTLLVNERWGSFLALGVAFLSVRVDARPAAIPLPADGCGHCRACVDACPGDALGVGDRTLDARRCASYLTVEKRGEVSEDEARLCGTWVAGCDVCQLSCPYNRPTDAEPMARDWLFWLELSGEQWKALNATTALSRLKGERFSRNLAIALANAVQEMEPEKHRAFCLPLFASVRSRCESEAEASAKTAWLRCLEVFERAIGAVGSADDRGERR